MPDATAFYGVNAPLFTSSSPIPPPQFPGIDIKQFSPGTTRVLAHIVVTLIVLAAGRLGQNTMTGFARSSMKAGNMVPLSYLGGWMTPAQMLGWMWKFREIPGGLYFTPMALTVLSGIAANLLIASFITAIAVPAVCTGQVTVATANSSVGWLDGQSPLDPSFNNALQVQAYSMANGGLPGLYWAAPIDSMFRATEKDVASSCNCTLSWTSVREASNNATVTYNALWSRVEGGNQSAVCIQRPAVLASCVAIATNFTDPDNLQVRFAIDGLSPDGLFNDTLSAINPLNGYTCNLANLPWLQARIVGDQFTKGLSEVVRSRLVPETRAMQDILMVMTNAMVSIDGYAPVFSAHPPDVEFGCIKVATRVQLPACVFIAACFVALVGWSIAWFFTLIMVRGALRTCPMGLEGWMDFAIRQQGASDIFGDTKISTKRRKDWAIAIRTDPVGYTQHVALVDRGSKAEY